MKRTGHIQMRLMPKFLLSLGVLGLLLTVSVAFFGYRHSKLRLEEQYAARVTVSCQAIADLLPREDVYALLAEDGGTGDAMERLSGLLNKLKRDGNITYLSLVVPDEDSVTFLVDAMVEELGDDPAAQIPYGTDILYAEAAADEADLENYLYAYSLYRENRGADEPLVTDNEYGYNYTGVAPVLDESGNAIAEVQYILDMAEVRGYLRSFLLTALLISFVNIAVMLVLYAVFVRNALIRPIARLADFTRQITGSGEFRSRRIELSTGDEIESLGHSFNYMMEETERYIDNLARITAEKERIGAELNIATQIQSSLLPRLFPDREEFALFATMDPAREVGGDFYDFFMVDERHLAVVMADVSGKGVPAALFMVIAKTLTKDHTQPGRDLGDVFAEVNELLCESNSEGMFVTAFEGVLDLGTGEFLFVNAGHEPPFLCRKNGEYEPYKIRPGFVLAGMEGIRYQSASIRLEPGDKLFQYTDGVTEATDSGNRLYGMERLGSVLRQNSARSPAELLPVVKRDIDAFVGEAPQFDDITMLCLEYRKKMAS